MKNKDTKYLWIHTTVAKELIDTGEINKGEGTIDSSTFFYGTCEELKDLTVEGTLNKNWRRFEEVQQRGSSRNELLDLVTDVAHARTMDEAWEQSERCYDYVQRHEMLLKTYHQK